MHAICPGNLKFRYAHFYPVEYLVSILSAQGERLLQKTDCQFPSVRGYSRFYYGRVNTTPNYFILNMDAVRLLGASLSEDN